MSLERLRKILDEVSVSKRKDVSPKTGLRKYGKDSEVNFADETNNKYPLDTEAHVRNALQRWGNQKNRDKYSPKDQAVIGRKIKAAAKKFGIGEE